MTDIDFLENVQIFNGLDREQLAEILQHCEKVYFDPGTRIFEQGEDARYLWIVEKGRVDLRFEVAAGASATEATISSISERGAFGWSSFTAPHQYRLSGYCTSQGCKLIKVSRDGLRRLFEKDPDIGYVVMSNVAAVVGTRFHEFQEEAARHKGADLLGGW